MGCELVNGMEEMERTYEGEALCSLTNVSKLFTGCSLINPLNRCSNAWPNQATTRTGVPSAALFRQQLAPSRQNSRVELSKRQSR